MAAYTVVLSLFLVLNGYCHEYKVVDLTHRHGNDSIQWPTATDFQFTVDHRGPWGNLWYESNTFKTTEHLETHVDAPAHLYKGSWRTDQIPIDNLVGPGVIINVKDKVTNNADYRVTQSDIDNWESVHGRIPDGAVVLMNSGWQTRYPNKTLVFNSPTPNDTTTFHFPSWHEDAISWLVKHRSVHVVGVDTPSNDYGPSQNFPAHVILGKHNIPGVENVANLDRVPDSGSIIFVNVLKLTDGSGGPARVVAYIGNEVTNSAISLNLFLAYPGFLFSILMFYIFV